MVITLLNGIKLSFNLFLGNNSCKNCNYYRGISLLKSGYKKYAKLIAQVFSTIANTMLLEEENGLRRNRSCINSVFSVAQLIEKHREYNILTYAG